MRLSRDRGLPGEGAGLWDQPRKQNQSNLVGNSAPWLRVQIYLFFTIARGQKLLLLAKEPVMYTFIQSVFIKH